MTVGTIATLRHPVRARSWSTAVPSGPAEGVVCLVTARAWYVACDGRVVGVLHGRGVGCVPGGVCIDDEALAGCATVAPGARVWLEGDRWTFRSTVGRSWVVERGGARAWEDRPRDTGSVRDGSGWEPARAAIEGLDAAAALAGRGDGAARARFCDVLDVLADPTGDPGAALDALVGFGPGLTPSGDDLLMGLLALLQARPDVCGPSNASVRLCWSVAQRLSATTPFSRFYLEHALAGRFAAALLDAREALLSAGASGSIGMTGGAGPAACRARAFGALVSVGATSGADLLSGMVEPLLREVNPGLRPAEDADEYAPASGSAR